MSRALRYLSRLSAYLIGLFLVLVWTAAAADTLIRPLFDFGRARVGDTILAIAGAVALPSQHLLQFAHLLAGLKFMVGAFLLLALIDAVVEKVRFGSCDDAMFDVALFVAAIASVAGAAPGLVHGGELLQATIGELVLCLAASGFAIYGRGYVIRDERPCPVRPPAYGAIKLG
jgi:hypothetical protein